MSDARAADLFARFFGNGDPFADGSGSDDDDVSSLLRNIRGGKPMGGIGGTMGGMDGTGNMNGRRAARRDRPDELPSGTVVKLVDLSNIHLNGTLGTVERFDHEKGRYVIALQDGQNLAAKPNNVRQVIAQARVVGTSQAQLNGLVAPAASYDHASKRYRVEGLTAGDSIMALKAENVILPQHTRVTVENVQSRPGLIGKKGKIVTVENERYIVQMQDDEHLRLRFGAVAAC